MSLRLRDEEAEGTRRNASAPRHAPVRLCGLLPNHALLDQGGAGGAAPGAPYRAAALEGRPGTARRAYAHDPMIGQAYRQHHGAGQSRHPWRISVQSRMQSLCGDLSPGFSADEDDGGQPRNAYLVWLTVEQESFPPRKSLITEVCVTSGRIGHGKQPCSQPPQRTRKHYSDEGASRASPGEPQQS